MTGRLNFLERCWGPVEVFDKTMTRALRDRGVFCHIVTDHCHYMETGGENYLQEYTTWDYVRGQEYDPWVSKVTPVHDRNLEHYGVVFGQYEANRTRFRESKDYPTPRTFAAAMDWLENNRGEDDFFLTVEVFDPHEPFDTPAEYLDLYQDRYSGPRFDCSTYRAVTEPADAIEHLKNRYRATVTMTDEWFGRFVDTLKKTGNYDDTLIILTSDHGHLLGEFGFTGKNFMHGYNQLSNIPLMIRIPGSPENGRRSDFPTQNIDLSATLLEYFGARKPDTMNGDSILSILYGHTREPRECLLFGWFGGAVNIFDGRYTYFRAAVREDNTPLFNYCSMPTTLLRFLGTEGRAAIEMGRFLPYTDFPVYRIPAKFPIGHLRSSEFIRETLLFDIRNDYAQRSPIRNEKIEQEMIGKLVRAMIRADAPVEQYERIGLRREFEFQKGHVAAGPI